MRKAVRFWDAGKSDLQSAEKQIPHQLNFTPTSAKEALVGDPRFAGS
jgi:hypothetical protein